MDEYTEKYMEDNPEIFPQSNLCYVVNKIKEGAALFPTVNDFAISLIGSIDPEGTGVATFE